MPSLSPFPIRVALVGSSVGLLTPVLAVIGTARIFSQVLPRKTLIGKILKYTIGFIIGGSSITLLYKYVIPFFRDHPDFVLPFALANSITSMLWYSVGEVTFGMRTVLGVVSLDSIFRNAALVTTARVVPIGGAAIGGLTAITAPILWPVCFTLCWSKELRNALLADNPVWPMDLYSYFVLPVALPMGIVAGASIHLVLKPIILGVPHIPYTRRGLPALLAILSSGALYFGMNWRSLEDFLWLKRKDPCTGREYSENVKTRARAPGPHLANSSQLRAEIVNVAHIVRKPLEYLNWEEEEAEAETEVECEENKRTAVRSMKLEMGRNIEISKMGEYKVLFNVIDELLRVKYAEMQPEVRRRESVLQRTLLYELENYIATTRYLTSQLNGNKETPKPSDARESEELELKLEAVRETQKTSLLTIQKILQSDHPSITAVLFSNGGKNQRLVAAELLLHNLDLLEDELRRALEYVVPDIDVALVLQEYLQAKLWSSIFFGAGVSLAVMGAAFVLSK